MTDFDTKVNEAIGRISKGEQNPDIVSLLNGYKSSKTEDHLSRLSVYFLAGALVYVSNYRGSVDRSIPFFESDILLLSVSTSEENLTEEDENLRTQNSVLFDKIVNQIRLSNNNTKNLDNISKKIKRSSVNTGYDPILRIKLSLQRYIRSVVYS